MPKLVLATFASATVMGAQVYERAIDQRAEVALGGAAGTWTVERVVVRSLRSPLTGNRRLPAEWIRNAPVHVRGMAARAIYPRSDLVHRMKVGLPPAPGRDVLTLHDIGPWKFSDEASPPPAAQEELKRARAIVTPSSFSASEIVDLFGVDDPVVIPNGFDRKRFIEAEALDAATRLRLGITSAYVLAAGGASERKNLRGLAAAWAQVRSARPDLSLVLAGPPHPGRTALFADLPGVVMVGRVDDDLVPGLMAGARALVVPSLYEGFGLPALEGMAVGIPVVAVRASSLPEVVGDAGILVEPSPAALAEGVIWATSDDSEVARLVSLGKTRSEQFSWERSAQAHADLWRRLAGG